MSSPGLRLGLSALLLGGVAGFGGILPDGQAGRSREWLIALQRSSRNQQDGRRVVVVRGTLVDVVGRRGLGSFKLFDENGDRRTEREFLERYFDVPPGGTFVDPADGEEIRLLEQALWRLIEIRRRSGADGGPKPAAALQRELEREALELSEGLSDHKTAKVLADAVRACGIGNAASADRMALLQQIAVLFSETPFLFRTHLPQLAPATKDGRTAAYDLIVIPEIIRSQQRTRMRLNAFVRTERCRYERSRARLDMGLQGWGVEEYVSKEAEELRRTFEREFARPDTYCVQRGNPRPRRSSTCSMNAVLQSGRPGEGPDGCARDSLCQVYRDALAAFRDPSNPPAERTARLRAAMSQADFYQTAVHRVIALGENLGRLEDLARRSGSGYDWCAEGKARTQLFRFGGIRTLPEAEVRRLAAERVVHHARRNRRPVNRTVQAAISRILRGPSADWQQGLRVAFGMKADSAPSSDWLALTVREVQQLREDSEGWKALRSDLARLRAAGVPVIRIELRGFASRDGGRPVLDLELSYRRALEMRRLIEGEFARHSPPRPRLTFQVEALGSQRNRCGRDWPVLNRAVMVRIETPAKAASDPSAQEM